MAQFKTPSRGRWARHNATGEVDAVLAPGAMSVNWPDRKIYVGGTNGVPVLFSQRLDLFKTNLTYKPGDIVIHEGNMLRATAQTGPSAIPVASSWEVILGNAQGFIYEAAITGMLDGGATAFSGTNIQIGAGNGIVVDNTEVEIPQIQYVSWGSLSLGVSYLGEAYSLVTIAGNGAVDHIGLSAADLPALRRTHLILCQIVWDTDLAEIIRLDDVTMPAGQMSETYRDAYFAEGGPYRTDGLRMSHNTGTFSLKFSAGRVFHMGGKWRTTPGSPNLRDIAEIPLATVQLVERGGVVLADRTEIDNTQYDNNGVMAAVPAGKATIQYVTALPDFSQIFVHYGQALYDSAFAAAEALPDDWDAFVPYAAPSNLFILIGALIVGEADTALVNGRVINAVNDAIPFTPAIAQETTGFFLTDGSRPMDGNLDMGDNDIENGGSASFTDITDATIQCRASIWA